MDEREFCRFVDETKTIVLAAVRKYLRAQYFQAIDDVVQETYIRAYRGLQTTQFADTKSMHNWLYTIAKNESLRMIEKFVREEARAQRLQHELEVLGEGEEKHDPEEIESLKKNIGALPEKYRLVFELLIEGQSEIEISKALSIKQGTVKSRIHRGKNMIYRMASRKEEAYE